MNNADRAIRSLINLQSSASTARTLNLWSIWKRHGQTAAYDQARFFQSPLLNRSIILKHRLRGNERDDFLDGRATATKIIIPIDLTNLAAGARSFFINQRGYACFLEEVSGSRGVVDSRDDALLQIIDGLPSLDPFLMRDRLNKGGFNPDRCYFNLSDADTVKIFEFVRSELIALIGMSFDDLDIMINEKTAKMAAKILGNAADAELEPLRKGMGMSKADFEEGVFCWKGFIYYKWALSMLAPDIRPVGEAIKNIRPNGQFESDQAELIKVTKQNLTRSLTSACETVRATLKIYEEAYADLTKNNNPATFREFLLKAPELFYELGERLGSLNHIISFWQFRFPSGGRLRIEADELIDILLDFEGSVRGGSEMANAA